MKTDAQIYAQIDRLVEVERFNPMIAPELRAIRAALEWVVEHRSSRSPVKEAKMLAERWRLHVRSRN